MKNLNPEFCRKAKVARKDAGLSQSELASEIGCKQSALSMFEQGDGTKLSDEVIEKIAKKFNLFSVRTARRPTLWAAGTARSAAKYSSGSVRTAEHPSMPARYAPSAASRTYPPSSKDRRAENMV